MRVEEEEELMMEETRKKGPLLYLLAPHPSA